MHDLEAAFLADIKANPHDWLPRLVFADWLEEQGDERAELIRLSHDLTRLKCEDRPQKEARVQELREAGVQWPTPKLENGLGMEFVLIPPGEFLMGSPEDEDGRGDNEEQVEVVLTKGFWLGLFPVTQQEWTKLMSYQPWYGQARLSIGNRIPATGVNWDFSNGFCTKLTNLEQKAGRLPAGFEFNVPTEAQWEYACRSGTTTRFSYGEDLEWSQLHKYAWFSKDARGIEPGSAQDAGGKIPNAWGIHDMHGNVWEWCVDWNSIALPGGTDPVVLQKPSFLNFRGGKVTRGGSWNNRQRMCRSASRDGHSIDAWFDNLGFRVACVPTG